MLYFALKAAISGILIALASEVARRSPALGALIISLPLTSVLAMIWIWREGHDPGRIISHSTATLWYLIPSVPLFLVISALMQRGVGFWPALAGGCALTVILYLLMVFIAQRFGFAL
jgi:hypothetical protein